MPYPHKVTEEQILEAAAELVDERGIDCLSTRALGERLAVSAPSLYRYFPDKEHLVDALSRRFLSDLGAALAGNATIEALGLAYWDYVRGHPFRYEAIVRLAHVIQTDDPALPEKPIEPFLDLASGIDPERAHQIARALWSYLHGAASLRLIVPRTPDLDLDQAFLVGLRALGEGLRLGQNGLSFGPGNPAETEPEPLQHAEHRSAESQHE
jgi:AcrR family transcriptional regulator